MTDVPALRFTLLERLVPGLVAGITIRPDQSGRGDEADFGLSTGGDLATVSRRYSRLATSLGFESVAAVRQVHGTKLVTIEKAGPAGFQVLDEADGLVTGLAGVLLAVTVADCVPAFVASAGGETIAMVHAGWRGTAGGVLSEGIRAVSSQSGCAESDLFVHLGPAICGSCYEVGPEVRSEFADPGPVPGHVDLRQVLVGQAIAAGVRPESVNTSAECTMCDHLQLHSHRGHGEKAGRMAAFMGRIA